MNKLKGDLWDVIGVFMAFAGLSMLRGWIVHSSLWPWFMVPLGLPSIGMAYGVGISFFVVFFTGTKRDETKSPWVNFGDAVALALILWGAAAIAHSFV